MLEGAFVDELALLQPTPGYMRLVKDRILCVWEQRRAEARERATEQQRRVSAIQQKLDKLDEAFLQGSVTMCACSFTTQGEQMPNGLTREKLRDLARSGAEAALKQLRAEIIAIERTFPELALPKRRKAIQKSFTRATRDARRMSAAARKAVSERMKKYWAERRKAKARVK
jgi:hypothetical protein